MYRPMAHKGTIGNPPRGPGGPQGFSGLGGIPLKPSLGGIGGKLVHPKGSWVPYKPFPSQKILGNLVGDRSLHKVMFFGPPFLDAKTAPGLPGPRSGIGGYKNGVRGQKYQSWTMKNPAESTGQCPKRGHTQGHMLQVMANFVLVAGGHHFFSGGGSLPLGRSLCPSVTQREHDHVISSWLQFLPSQWPSLSIMFFLLLL